MDITLVQLRALVAVARYASFTLAADALHRSQPAVTAQVKQLEDALGLRLFDRSTRQLRLTSVGLELVPLLSRLLHELDGVVETSRKLRAKTVGVVRVACLPSVAAGFLPAHIAAFRRKHPGITFLMNDALGDRVNAMVKAGEVEFGISDLGPGTAELDATHLMHDRICAFFLAGHPLETAKRVDVDELGKYDLVLTAHGSSLRRLVDGAFAAHGRPAVPICEVTYNSTAVGMVRAGLGVALLTASSVDLQVDPRLRYRPVEGGGFEREIGIVKLRHKTLSPAAAEFVRSLMQRRAPVTMGLAEKGSRRRAARPQAR